MTGYSGTQFDATLLLFIVVVIIIIVSTPAFTYTYISARVVAEDIAGKFSMPGFSEWGRTGALEFKLFPLIFLLRSCVVNKNLGFFYYVSIVYLFYYIFYSLSLLLQMGEIHILIWM